METLTKSKAPQLRLLRFAGGHKTVQGEIDMEKELAIRDLAHVVRDQLGTSYIQALSKYVADTACKCRKSSPST